MQASLGQKWLCFLCTADVQAKPKDCRGPAEAASQALSILASNESAATARSNPCKAETTLLLRPKDAYRRRIFLQPWGLYLVAEAGCFQSLQISMLTGIIQVTFEEPDMLLNSRSRLRIEQTSELEHHLNMSICLLDNLVGIDSNLQHCSDRPKSDREHDKIQSGSSKASDVA